MSAIRIETKNLLELLGSLVYTAAQDPEDGAVAGVLLHTDRGERGLEPGRTDLLVGTSCNGFAVGQTYVHADGQLHEPMLWRIDDVRTVIDAFKRKAKEHKEHAVEIRIDEGVFVVRESEDALFEADGLRLEFSPGRIEEYPRTVWSLLVRRPDFLEHRDSSGRVVPAVPRTDFGSAALEPFVRVAKARKSALETYRYHQRSPLLVQIGTSYIGAVTSYRWDDDIDGAGQEPDAAVYVPDLPPPPRKPEADADLPPGSSILRDGAGVVLSTADTSAVDEPLSEFPDLERDPDLLCQAAEVLITGQLGSVTLLQRKLRIGATKANRLIDQLVQRGVLGPARGSKAREVLVPVDGLAEVLEEIRGGAQ
ncbi:DNA translocase FtsK [Amycolatopsis methanolica]|uniref:Cell division protein FtsK n=1 Tax=Amycolatopsis methanolica 239 TaxID=1068978 RepID=A0A076MZ19_AMYME|nr:DNA translocase FtsK [Amycolatopsis methanolica]AIJ26390.1 cell division protein FtsK [Amycolatopsis methanolica 239]AIJ26449.1 cell division protein FtsK [Amycolatopsis methanolica 239]